MGVSDDLAPEAVRAAVGDRPLRAYPALLSTEADALAWARSGGPHGAVVVAEYQASPRGRAGLPWAVDPQADLAFSVVLRPHLTVEREGWLYTVASLGLADVLGDDVAIDWPDQLVRDHQRIGAVGVTTEPGPVELAWATVNVFAADVPRPRGVLLEAMVEAVQTRCECATEEARADYLARCSTLGRSVRARMIPLGPGGPQISGRAVDCLDDGALVLETASARRVAVRPQHLGLLDEVGPDEEPGRQADGQG